MKQLAKMQDSEVTQVGNLIYALEKKFQITQNGGTEVVLGLLLDGTEVAIKIMPISQFSELETTLKKLRKAQLNSQNIVSYIDTAKKGDFGYVALQLCEDNLEKHKKVLQTIGDPKSKVKEVLTGLKDLHEKRVTHGNIKPQNVLFGKYFVKESFRIAITNCKVVSGVAGVQWCFCSLVFLRYSMALFRHNMFLQQWKYFHIHTWLAIGDGLST